MSQGAVLRIGLLGAARITPAAIMRPARAVEGVEVVAIAARDVTRAASFARVQGIPHVHANYEAMLVSPDIDAVYIALPNAWHFAWTLRALAEGKHVLCEKPLTSNALEAEVLARRTPASPLLMEAMHSLYHPLNRRASEIVRGGELGEIVRVDATFRTPMLRRHDIRFEYGLGGGAMMDLGCYMVSLTRRLTGEELGVVRAEATLLNDGVDRRMRSWLNSTGGARVHFDVEMRSQRIPDIRLIVTGSRGVLRLYNPVLPGIWHRLVVRTGRQSRQEAFARVSSYACQLRAFVEAVARPTSIDTGADDALQSMRVIDAVYRAAGMQPRGYPSHSPPPDEGK